MVELRAILFCLTMVGCFRQTMAAESLLRVGQPPIKASFVAATSAGTLQFQVADQSVDLTAQDLVRWSNPTSNLDHSELLLVDGSRLVLAAAWTGQQPWQMEGESIVANTKLFGKVSCPRDQVRAIVIRAPADVQQRTQFLDQLLEESRKTDVLRLTNRDQWAGRLLGIPKNSEGQRHIAFAQESESEPLRVSEDRIAAIVFGHVSKDVPERRNLIVCSRDGSLLTAESLVADVGQLRLRLTCGLELIGSNARDVVHLRSLVAPCVYLSDLVASDYQHLPYLQLKWPLRRDRNVLAGPLQASGRNYGKGLGMLTAARLTYRLDSPKIADRFRRLVADVAVDDAAGRRGSVIFRVYLERDSQWQLAYASPIVRGGESPVPVTVELDDARQLALVTDFADRGDERDYANWLDARLE